MQKELYVFVSKPARSEIVKDLPIYLTLFEYFLKEAEFYQLKSI